jgi:hypothetical protein
MNGPIPVAVAKPNSSPNTSKRLTIGIIQIIFLRQRKESS